MKRIFFTLVALAMAMVTTFAQQKASHKDLEISVNGTKRKIRIYVPANLPDNAPLVISFHGFNQDPQYQMDMTKWNTVADKEKFAVVYPYAGFWDVYGDDDVNLTKSIIRYMNTNYKINKNRVYATGFSLGAMMTYQLINKMAKEIAAFAPASGVRFDNKKPSGARHVPLYHHHGSGDDVFKFGGDLGHAAGGYPSITEYVTSWAKWNGCDMDNKKTETSNGCTYYTWVNAKEGIETKYKIVNGAGHWPYDTSTQEMWDFMKRYSLDGDCGALLQRAIPADGKTGLTNQQSFTLAFYDYMNAEKMTATLKGNGQTIQMKSSTTSTKTKSIKFTFDDQTELVGGDYTLTVNNVQTSTGGVKGHITLKYSFEACAPTGVANVSQEKKSGMVYSLTGIVADNKAKGIVITDGKKVYKR